ncbi:hypothetical protein FKM82_003843 [Ascaphus truei]
MVRTAHYKTQRVNLVSHVQTDNTAGPRLSDVMRPANRRLVAGQLICASKRVRHRIMRPADCTMRRRIRLSTKSGPSDT